MIAHRAMRDIEKCRAKYGDAWEEYERQVPYLFIPVSHSYLCDVSEEANSPDNPRPHSTSSNLSSRRSCVGLRALSLCWVKYPCASRSIHSVHSASSIQFFGCDELAFLAGERRRLASVGDAESALPANF